jgi:hypothetical protein
MLMFMPLQCPEAAVQGVGPRVGVRVGLNVNPGVDRPCLGCRRSWRLSGLDLVALAPVGSGESGTAFWVSDVNPPVLAGDRAFDLATLLFYLYDRDDIRDRPRTRLLEPTGPKAARAYLARMVLRQVDWSLRYHPRAAATRRPLYLADRVTADIDRRPAR